jgi:cell wall-associated NlpC family hydrolase
VSVIPGNTVQISNNSPSKMYYIFSGWATSQLNANARVVSYRPGNYMTVNSNVNLYAVWTVNTGLMDPANEVINASNKPVNLKLFIEALANVQAPLTGNLQKIYEVIPLYFKTPYGSTGLDCGGLVRAVFLEGLNKTLSTSGGDPGTQEYNGKVGRTTNAMFTAVSGTRGIVIWSKDQGTLDLNVLKPGHVLFFNLSGDSTIDHAALYIGKTADGRHIILETNSTSDAVHFVVLNGSGVRQSKDIVGVKNYF